MISYGRSMSVINKTISLQNFMNGSNNERKRNLVPNSLTLTREANKYYPARGDPSPQPRSAWSDPICNAHLPKQKIDKATQTLSLLYLPETPTQTDLVTCQNWITWKAFMNKCAKNKSVEPSISLPRSKPSQEDYPILEHRAYKGSIEDSTAYHSPPKSSFIPIPTSPIANSKKHVTFSKTT